MARRDRLTIVVSGSLAGGVPQAGTTWTTLQYILGMRRLGHRVYVVEPLRASALRPAQVPLARSANAAYFRMVVRAFGLERSSALLLDGTQETVGLSYVELCQIAQRADILFNVSGVLTDERLRDAVARRVYLDLDPGFTQIWHSQGVDVGLDGHTHFVTIGQGIGDDDCHVPTGGLRWLTTWQPIVLKHWPVADRVVHDALTTIANWRSYGSIEHNGISYGQKAHSLRPLIALPRLVDETFALALAIHPDERKDLAALSANGWHLVDPERVASTPARYRSFIQGSKGELGIAKSGYVAARCGWFSDRSICYLASGRPVLAQDTGFGRFLPTGEGLFAFATVDDVLASVETLRRDYRRHARAARAIAEDWFDSDKVLTRLIDVVGVTGNGVT